MTRFSVPTLKKFTDFEALKWSPLLGPLSFQMFFWSNALEETETNRYQRGDIRVWVYIVGVVKPLNLTWLPFNIDRRKETSKFSTFAE